MGNVRSLQCLPPELARLADQMATYGSCISLISFSGRAAQASPGCRQRPFQQCPRQAPMDLPIIFIKNNFRERIRVSVAVMYDTGIMLPHRFVEFQGTLTVYPSESKKVDLGRGISTTVLSLCLNAWRGTSQIHLSDSYFTIERADVFRVYHISTRSNLVCKIPDSLPGRPQALKDGDIVVDLDGNHVRRLPANLADMYDLSECNDGYGIAQSIIEHGPHRFSEVAFVANREYSID